MGQGDVLDDHAAHRVAQEVEGLPPECIGQRDHVAREGLEGE
jgi:hypothetical protein